MKKILLMKRYLNYMIFDILYILSIEISNNGSNHLRKFSFLRSMGCPVKIKEEYYKGTPFIIHPTCFIPFFILFKNKLVVLHCLYGTQ